MIQGGGPGQSRDLTESALDDLAANSIEPPAPSCCQWAPSTAPNAVAVVLAIFKANPTAQ